MSPRIMTVASLAVAAALAACSTPSGNPPGSAPATGTSHSASQEASRSAEATAESEEQAQAGEGILGDLPDPVYDYQGVLDYPKGRYAATGYIEYGNSFQASTAKIDAELSRIGPLPSTASPEQLNRVFKQLLWVAAADYIGTPNLNRFGYIVFRKDGKHPVTGQALTTQARVNVEIVLDASSSMADKIDGKPMMDIAKTAISDIVKALPATANVGLRVYGHQGDDTKAGQATSCGSTQLLQPLTTLNASTVQQKLATVKPTGWTPLAKAVQDSGRDFTALQNPNDLNIVYVISDGVETCGGNPTEAAKQVAAQKIKPILGIVGFNVGPSQQRALKQVADAAQGHYATADTAKALTGQLRRIHELTNTRYAWKPLDEGGISEVRVNQSSGILTYSNDINGKVTAEGNHLYTLVHRLVDLGKVDLSSDSYTALQNMIEERRKKIRDMWEKERARQEAQTKTIERAHRARLGEDSFIVIPVSGASDEVKGDR